MKEFLKKLDRAQFLLNLPDAGDFSFGSKIDEYLKKIKKEPPHLNQ